MTQLLEERKPDGRGRPAIARLRKISPCEHGCTLHVTHLLEGAEFWMPECVDARGRQRYHRVTKETYPVEKEFT